MRNKFVYSYSIKIHASGIQWTLGEHFLPSTGCGSTFPTKSCWDTWRSGSQLSRGQVNWQMRQNFITQFIQLLKHWLYNMWSGIVVENNLDQTGSQPPNSNHDLFLVQVWLWEVLCNFSIQPLSWSLASCHTKSTFHHMSQSDQEMVPCCCVKKGEKMTLQKQWFFYFQSAYVAFSLFQFASNAKQL